MRFLAIILSFYFLALNVVPCGDDGYIESYESIESIVDSDHDVEHKDCGICSPFCQCHCCHTHVIGTQNFFMESHHELISEEIITIELETFQEVSFDILQPPQNIG